MVSVTPFLWFDNNAEEAVEFYSSIFDDVKVEDEQRMPEGGPAPAGSLLTATVHIAGQRLMVLNGGPHFSHTEAFSLFVSVEGQEEVDKYWNALLEGGEPSQCGWLKDKFGLSWQIVPTALGRYLSDPDPQKAGRVMAAMMQMVKLDVTELDKAYAG